MCHTTEGIRKLATSHLCRGCLGILPPHHSLRVFLIFFLSFLMASSNVWKHGLVAGPRNFSVRVCRALYIALLSTTRFYTTAVHHSDGTALCLLNEHQLVSTESIKFPMPCISLYSLLKHQSVKCCHTEKYHSPFSSYIFVCAKGQPLAFKGNQTSRFWHPIFIFVQRAGGFLF